jgi:L-rhamnose mutarotase
MSTSATFEDVNLILRLYELRRETKLREARDWFGANYKGVKTMDDVLRLGPPGSKEDAYVRMVTSYWDMVSSFITSGVLNRALFFQSGGELLFTWFRIEAIVPLIRQMYGNPGIQANHEQVANEYIKWVDSKNPGAAEKWRQMATS